MIFTNDEKNWVRRTDVTYRRIRTIDRSIEKNKNKTRGKKNLELVGKAMCYIFAKKGPLDGHRYHCDKTTEIPKCFQPKKPRTNVKGKRNDRKFAKYFIDRVTYFRIRDKWEEFFLIAHFVYFFYVQQVLFSLRQKKNEQKNTEFQIK